MKVLLITPPYHAGVVEVAGRWVPLYFVYLCGALRAAGHDARIYDAMTKFVGYEDIARAIEDFRPDMVATTAITCTSPDAIEVMQVAKRINPGIITLCGGVHASFMYEEMFSLTGALDYIAIGEGERTIAELAAALEAGGGPGLARVNGIAYREGAGIRVTQPRAYIENLDGLPRAWDALDWQDYTYFIYPGSRLGAVDTSRGCEKECSFCSQQKFWKRSWRARSPEDIVADIEVQQGRHGVDVILFTDDYPSPDRARWERLLDLLIERDLGIKFLMETRAEDIIRDEDILWKYRKAGIVHIYIGTESTDQASLEMMKKELSLAESKRALALCRAANIITETSMILGLPDDTAQSIARTIELVKDYNPDFAHFLAIAPWPYSDLYKDLEPFVAVRDYKKYNLIDPVIKPRNMTLEQVDLAIVSGYRDFYMNKFMDLMGSDDEFRRDYLMRSMKLMMSNSFIKKKLGMLGEMPAEIRRILSA